MSTASKGKFVRDKSAINRMLAMYGLPKLESGRGLLAALGSMVEDHNHLRSLLVRCEPENRAEMYNSLRPYLEFMPWPMDDYIAQAKARAEGRQLPELMPNGDFKFPVENPTPASIKAAHESIQALLQPVAMLLTCEICGQNDAVEGRNRADAVAEACRMGWVCYVHEEKYRMICPECPVSAKAS